MNLAAKKKETKKGAPPVEAGLLPQLEEALKKGAPGKRKEAKQRVDDLLKGDLSWTDLFALPAEKLRQMAEIGYEQFKSGGYQRAEKIFRGLTVIDPENYYYHQILGATFQRQEKYPEAILEYSVAGDLNQKDVVSLTNRGECYLKLGLHPLALQDFDRVLTLDSSGDNRWANRARMLKEQVQLMGSKKGKK